MWSDVMGRRKSKQAQDALLQKVNEDTLKSLTQAKDSGPSGDSGRKVSEVVSYRSHADVPIVRDYIIQASASAAASRQCRQNPSCLCRTTTR